MDKLEKLISKLDKDDNNMIMDSCSLIKNPFNKLNNIYREMFYIGQTRGYHITNLNSAKHRNIDIPKFFKKK